MDMSEINLQYQESVMIQIDSASFQQLLNLLVRCGMTINGVAAFVVLECTTSYDEARTRNSFKSIRTRLEGVLVRTNIHERYKTH